MFRGATLLLILVNYGHPGEQKQHTPMYHISITACTSLSLSVIERRHVRVGAPISLPYLKQLCLSIIL